MKTALVALVLATIAPTHVTLGPVCLPAIWLVAAVEAASAAGGLWLAVRVIRRYRSRRWPRIAYGGAR